MRKLRIYCDGGSRGNPGPAASAIVIKEGRETIYKESAFLKVSTNNVAEYYAVLMAFKWLLKNSNDILTIDFVLDSQLAAKQLAGVYKIKSQNLLPLITKVKKAEKSLKAKITYVWTPREKNKEADRLVNLELDKNFQTVT
ncbi:ribonuclease HI family protein [Patescibacteria group bacterium]|nr:ribonuclease HI family protein [Patescibacteria group bacterium]